MDENVLIVHRRYSARRQTAAPDTWDADSRRLYAASALEMSRHLQAPDFPPIVYIEPTNACNSNCVMCPRRNMRRPIGYMDMPLFHAIIDQLARIGPVDLRLFNFGEPLLHPQLPEMLRAALARGMRPRVQTNGILLSDAMIARLLDTGTDYLGISINCIRPEEYSVIRPGHSFALLERNLRALRAAARNRQPPLHIHINAHMLKDELDTRRDQINGLARHWSGVADSISVSGLMLHEKTQLWKDDGVYDIRLEEQDRAADATLVCTEPFDRLVIKWDGRATPCCADCDALGVVGDLRSQTLEQIWQSPELDRLRAAVRARRYRDIPLCRDCCKLYSRPFSIVFKRKPDPDPRL